MPGDLLLLLEAHDVLAQRSQLCRAAREVGAHLRRSLVLRVTHEVGIEDARHDGPRVHLVADLAHEVVLEDARVVERVTQPGGHHIPTTHSHVLEGGKLGVLPSERAVLCDAAEAVGLLRPVAARLPLETTLVGNLARHQRDAVIAGEAHAQKAAAICGHRWVRTAAGRWPARVGGWREAESKR